MPRNKNIRIDDVPDYMKERAHESRENPTEAEALLWEHINRGQLGVTFWRQHCLHINGVNVMLDFYCQSANLAVEVDGPIHQFKQKEDAIRNWRIQQQGIRILRFTNEEVFNDPRGVASQILNTL